MCTLSVIRVASGARLVFSRDERRTRALGSLPEIVRVGERQAIMPTDPVGGGTWIVATDAGLAVAILNGNPTSVPPGVEVARGSSRGPRSRGRVVVDLAGAPDLAAVEAIAGAMDLHEFGRFRLVATDGDSVVSLRWDGETLHHETSTVGAGVTMFTSSGLGDALVEGPRRSLLEELIAHAARDGRSLEDVQHAFHRHRWADRGAVSVEMSREDARTVSRATIDLAGGRVRMAYEDLVRGEGRTLAIPVTPVPLAGRADAAR